MKTTVEVDGFGMEAAADHGSEESIANGKRISPVLPTFFSEPNLQVRTSMRFCFHRSHPSTVKDMMDLESVHMEYLADSLCICFLSDETKGVGSIIESILQCALDFRSCITFGAWDSEDLSGKLSKINISQ
ncbi:hypothetical protein V8G54_016962 [Vigna mungo]|uniref:Gamma tubulin complex component C-terminal domain-containing protein n=1 Tax=Vigna mungo TaxID=3915 RepID=A0AAQ3NNK8_VIGMU